MPFWPNVQRLKELSALNSVINPNAINADNDKTVGIISNKQKDIYQNRRATLKLRIIDCALYGISLILGYSLMLVVMTFNVGLILVIVLGYGCGRFIFHRKT
eukprot:150847_1